jgi:hypothetical protein
MKELFNDNNSINEKSLIGFLAFLVMVGFAAADVITGYYGKDLVVNEFIFNSFLILCLGAFGFGSVDKYINSNKSEE